MQPPDLCVFYYALNLLLIMWLPFRNYIGTYTFLPFFYCALH